MLGQYYNVLNKHTGMLFNPIRLCHCGQLRPHYNVLNPYTGVLFNPVQLGHCGLLGQQRRDPPSFIKHPVSSKTGRFSIGTLTNCLEVKDT